MVRTPELETPVPTTAVVDAAGPPTRVVERLAPGPGAPGALGDRARLVLLSFLMLFVELALIRWAGSNIVYLSYFSNFVLLGSFLGIGIGFLRARRAVDLSGWGPLALGLFVLVVTVFPVEVRHDDASMFFFTSLSTDGPPMWVVLPIVFLFSAVVLMFITEGVARTFVRFEPLEAYKLDLLGSVLGILGFAAVSFLRLPPIAWGTVAVVCWIVLLIPRRPSLAQLAGFVALCAVLLVESTAPDTLWSPYYKVSYERTEAPGNPLFVSVNGVGHQLHQRADQAPGRRIYEVAQPPTLDEVLVIGSGGGNDVAAALAHGARHVDAVEIDPVLYELGRDHHPDQPYSDPRVDIHIDDGRAFLERTDRHYDLIVFALPDSITLVSGQGALRLESYLFTKEALTRARDHLTPGGVFAMYNYYRTDWLIDRYGSMLEDAFGRPPCFQTLIPPLVDDGVPLDAFLGSEDAASVHCDGVVDAATWSPRGESLPAAATDDHPFPYLRDRSMPSLYLVTLGLILLASVVAIRVSAGPLRPMIRFADLFFMGVAFLLLETKHIVQFALLFGTTWFVNALVFLGVLLSILLAVAVSRRVSLRRPERLYIVLVLALVVAFLLPSHWLLNLPFLPRFTAAVTVAFFPIFTANMVFAQRFKDTGDSATAFGANLLGAMFGGVLEYFALVTGYRTLIVLVAVVYGLAFVFGRRSLSSPAFSPAPT